MSRKNAVCVTPDTKSAGGNVANPTCPGTIVRYETPLAVPVVVNGVTYNSYEQCLRCGKVYPG